MNPVLERLPHGGRVAVIRLRSLGDCVLTTPALRILKSARPDLEIGVVVESGFAGVFEGNPDVHTILPPSISAIARFSPQLTINLHGGTRSMALTAASHARYRAGFQHFRAQWAYNLRIPRAQEILHEDRTVHTAEHLASAVFWLGAPQGDIPRACLFAQPLPAARPTAVIHPFASAPAKTWPAERFSAAARHLRSSGIEPVILCGPFDDPSAFAGFETVRNAPLSEVKSIIAAASLFLGNDSGPAHMACALGVPLVVLFGPSDHVIWAPWKPVAAEQVVREVITDITAGEVIRAIDQLKVRA
jgi:heptosyltransferase III